MTPFLIVVGLMTALVLAALLVPLLLRHRRAPAPRREYDLAIYRDQLKELDSDRARGLVEDAAYQSARTEIERRMLALARAEPGAAETGAARPARRSWRDRLALAALVVGVPLGALGLYGALGSPSVPDEPLAARAPQAAPGVDPHEPFIAELEERLAGQPDDVEGWRTLGRTYLVIGRPQEAVSALRNAWALEEGDPGIASELGEALVFEAEGIVTPEARDLFEEARAADPADLAAPFYLGLAHAQRGEPEAALAVWRPLYARAPGDAPWLDNLYELMAQASDEAGVEPPERRAVAQQEPPSGMPGAAAEAETAGTFSDEERAMIEGMVGQLATRLEEQPDDLEGWLRLARSYEVLGEKDGAAAAYREAAARAPDDLAMLSQIAEGLVLASPENAPLPPEVAALYERIRGLDPDDPPALWYLAIVAAEKGDEGEAIVLLERLQDLLPADSADGQLVANQLKTLRGGG